jgi:hypothetical protein
MVVLPTDGPPVITTKMARYPVPIPQTIALLTSEYKGSPGEALLNCLKYVMPQWDIPGAHHGVSRLMSRGKSAACLTLARDSNCLANRSKPMAIPPWGGMPYLKHCR